MFQEFKFRLTVALLVALFFGGIFYSPTIDRYVRYYWNMFFGAPPAQTTYTVHKTQELPYGWKLEGFLCSVNQADSPCRTSYTIGDQTVSWVSASLNEVTVGTSIGNNIVWVDQSIDINGTVPIKLIVRRPSPTQELLVLVLVPQ